jgi:translation initiation factor eIF-2B subunit beta
LTAALHKLFDDEKMEHVTSAITLAKVKSAIIEDISELIDEIKTVYASISDQAVEHIHAKEIILTFGRSKTVVEFFEEAARLRKFEVIVAEGAPSYSGHEMAVQLAKLGIETTVITDSAVFAMMGVVNKIVVGTHAVMANGGLIAHTGAYNIAAAAKAHSVPLVVVAGLYKLCPLFAFDQDSFNEQSNPADVLGASHGMCYVFVLYHYFSVDSVHFCMLQSLTYI